MKIFAKIVKSFQPLTIPGRSSILGIFYDAISLSCHEQVYLSGLRFERYFSHHRTT